MGIITVRELKGLAEMTAAYPLVRQSNPELDEPTFELRLAAMVAEGGYRCVAAYRNDALAGVAGFWIGTGLWCGRYCEPDNVVVDRAERGGGIGKILMDWIEDEARRAGCALMKLETFADRVRARKFYGREGFAEPGIVMIKPLPTPGAMTLDEILAKGRH